MISLLHLLWERIRSPSVFLFKGAWHHVMYHSAVSWVIKAVQMSVYGKLQLIQKCGAWTASRVTWFLCPGRQGLSTWLLPLLPETGAGSANSVPPVPIVSDVPQFSKALLTCPKHHCCCGIHRTAHPTPEVHPDFWRSSACWFCISPFFPWPLPFLYYLPCSYPLFKRLILSLLLLTVLLRLIKPASSQQPL